MSEIAALEAEVKEFKLQLETVQSTPPAAPQPAAAKDKGAKDSYSTQSNYRKPTAEQPDEPAPSYQSSFSVNENVLARWVSGDNSFYPARITSITGSSSNPVYLVSFKSYGTVESLTSKDIRPISSNDSRKRKADAGSGNSSSQSPAPQPSHSSVISAAADINPALANQARQEPTKVSEGSARPTKAARKVKANKELEAGKMKWKDFASKGKLGRKKDSMFRTGDGVNARVGFTGSGQQMRKDPTRSRHVYQQGEEEGY